MVFYDYHPLTILSLFFRVGGHAWIRRESGASLPWLICEVRDHSSVAAAARMSGMFSRRGWSPTKMGAAARRSWTTLALIAVAAVLSREGKIDYREITPISNA